MTFVHLRATPRGWLHVIQPLFVSTLCMQSLRDALDSATITKEGLKLKQVSLTDFKVTTNRRSDYRSKTRPAKFGPFVPGFQILQIKAAVEGRHEPSIDRVL